MDIPAYALKRLLDHTDSASDVTAGYLILGRTAKGRALILAEAAPWADPVEGGELLDAIEDKIKQFVVCEAAARTATALWIAATWFEEAAQVAPILNLQSPEKRCGKTTLLAVITRLVKRSLPASNISAAALFRVVEECQPTLIIDEADAFLNDNEEARGIIQRPYPRRGFRHSRGG